MAPCPFGQITILGNDDQSTHLERCLAPFVDVAGKKAVAHRMRRSTGNSGLNLAGNQAFSFPARFQFINSPIVDPVLDAGCL